MPPAENIGGGLIHNDNNGINVLPGEDVKHGVDDEAMNDDEIPEEVDVARDLTEEKERQQ